MDSSIDAPYSARSGIFIVFEGIDGSGKSLQAKKLAEHLSQLGIANDLTREPGGTPVAEKIRELILDPANADIDDRTEAFLFAAARSHHVQGRILPGLESGKVVISDRFVASSIAYQGAGRGLGEAWVEELNAAAVAGVMPDVTVVLDLSAQAAADRRAKRETATGQDADRIEQAPDGFQATLRESFIAQAQAQPASFIVVDALGDPEQIHQSILTELDAVLGTDWSQAKGSR